MVGQCLCACLEVMLRNKNRDIFVALTLFVIFFFFPGRAMAQDGDEPIIPDKECLSCHAQPNMQTELPSGETLFLTIDPERHLDDVHRRVGYRCVDCHTEITGYPHPEITAYSRREYTLEMYTLCQECHGNKYNQTLDSTHQKALAAGNENAAVCTDCHGAHYMETPGEPRSNIAKMCQQCHSEIYNQYQDSVHGAALLEDEDPNVPTCTDCHGVHDIAGPSTEEAFHLFSPQICAECHADKELMAEYGISTNVFETYISDFHGTTVILFQKTTPDQETNKPVCVDCHGVHNMKEVDDPESKVIKDNLLDTCQKCHPNASGSFPSSWLGHYQPTPDRHPFVYFVNVFYKILIPTTVGVMLVFVASDIWRRISKRTEPSDE